MKKLFAASIMTLVAASASSEILRIENFNYAGPFPVKTPVMIDSLDVNGKAFVETALENAPDLLPVTATTPFSGTFAPGNPAPAIHVLSFEMENTSFANPRLQVDGLKNYSVYVDGKKVDGKSLKLKPSTHNVAIRYLSQPGEKADSLKVSLNSEGNSGMSLRNDGKRRFTLDDVLHGTTISNVSMSPDGKYLIAGYTTTRRGGKSVRINKIISVPDGKVVDQKTGYLRWLPAGSSYTYEREGVDGKQLVAVDAASGMERTVVNALPKCAYYVMTPDEKSLILTDYKEGRKESGGVYEILEPEDRQPGWRQRSYLSIYDIATGVTSPLTFGHKNVSLNDISADSKKLLFSTSRSRLEKRPTTVFSIFVLDLPTMSVDTLIWEDGFAGNAKFSPDGKKVLLSGSPEAYDGIGLDLPAGRTPNMTENELYVMDIATKQITPLTKKFNPSVESFTWSEADGQIYLTAENRDRISLYRLDPNSGKVTEINAGEDAVNGFSVPEAGKYMAWYGESVSNPKSLYLLDTKTLRSTKLDTPKAEMLSDVQLGTCEEWDFVNSKGDTICGRFYLPPDFDPNKKYPLIVNYYGGCSPSTRNFEGRYPHNAYAAQGYVVYVVQPSGATGFGQEFASRHVNTAGEGVAEDIIEGTKKFCETHPYVDATKIGCIGASYGGFMTQYLQTVTDLFAAAVSHAGISDHTSYWGEGYWGYSYSEVSMANSYPWSETDLYVKQSPLYRADKIHTPLLFLHGDADHNVPVGESIQMFTALKLLGRPTAFVAVEDQDHHILDYSKRIKWQDTIFAWFAKYLKDDASWWEELYPKTEL